MLKPSSRFVSNGGSSLTQRGATTDGQGCTYAFFGESEDVMWQFLKERLLSGFRTGILSIFVALYGDLSPAALCIYGHFSLIHMSRRRFVCGGMTYRKKKQKTSIGTFSDPYAKKPALHCVCDISELSRGGLLNSKCRFKGKKIFFCRDD